MTHLHLPVDFSVGDIQWQIIVAEWLEIVQWSPSLFQTVPLLTTYGLPFPQNRASKYTHMSDIAFRPWPLLFGAVDFGTKLL